MLSAKESLQFDIRRTLILGQYIAAWGLPEHRVISTHEQTGVPVEVYLFPPSLQGKIQRIATVGCSQQCGSDGTRAKWELFFAIPSDLGGATFGIVSHYILDIMAHLLFKCTNVQIGQTIAENSLAPTSWNPRGVLIDEPRGEPHELETFEIGDQTVSLLWLVPIFDKEVDLIRAYGVEAFDAICEKAEQSVADVSRSSFL